MARTKGPLFSLEANGSIGNALTYSTWKGQSLVKSKVAPANPNTLDQRGARTTIRFLNELWAQLSPAEKAEWEPEAAAKGYTSFNAFTSENVRRTAQQQGPMLTPAGGDAYSNPTVDGITIDGAAGQINVGVQMLANWSATDWIAVAVAAEPTTSPAPIQKHLIEVQPGVTDTLNTIVPDVPPGLYTVTTYGHGTNGVIWILQTDINVTVT